MPSVLNDVLKRSAGFFAVVASGLAALTAGSLTLRAQGSLADYRRAEQFLPVNAERLVFNDTLKPNWSGPGDRFWYARGSPQGTVFLAVDPGSGAIEPAFDHARLAQALSKLTGTPYQAGKLPFTRFEFVAEGRAIEFKLRQTVWRCDLRTYECTRLDRSVGAAAGEITSPDHRWVAGVKGHNLYVRELFTGRELALTHDGEADNGYELSAALGLEGVTAEMLGEETSRPLAFFSPDSKRLLTFRIDLRKVAQNYLLETRAVGLPVLHAYRYMIPGAKEIAWAIPTGFEVATGRRVDLACPPLPLVSPIIPLLNPNGIQWNAKGTQVYFIREERGRKTTTVYAADAATGRVSPIVEEHSATYVNREPNLTIIGDGAELIWSSERDGWKHLYLIDGGHGGVKRQLTSGSWVVRDVVRVDERTRWVYFTAGGREPDQDPYYRHLYRVRLDGTQLELLTPEDADHEISFSPAGGCFTDTYSRVNTVPRTVLRRPDGTLIAALETADLAPLLAKGWKFPEPFRALARDGRTPIYGAIYRPSTFDPAKKYPVIDSDYPGPQAIRVSKSLSVVKDGQDQALAELGFIVVTIDGMGTPFRSKAFCDVAYGNWGDAGGLEDHIAAIRQLGERYPYLDVDRVGIYGHSGGGYASARALLKYPDFYKVAVSSDGNHDMRGYWAEWGERYEGYPVDDQNYARQANAPLAGNLKGKLLLVQGTLDDNVNPSNLLQLADALIAANKDFDLLILPNRNHGLVNLAQGNAAWRGVDPYFIRRRWDYFVTNLLGVEPPHEYRITLPSSPPLRRLKPSAP
jgi:dienelactone hydrolase